MISLIKNLLYIFMDQHIFLMILKIIVVMTRDYKKCCNVSLLIYRGYIFIYIYIFFYNLK